jgi:hypothetical protein
MFWRKKKKNKIDELMSKNLSKQKIKEIDTSYENQISHTITNKSESKKDINSNVTVVIVLIILVSIGISLLREKKEKPFCDFNTKYRYELSECMKLKCDSSGCMYEYQTQFFNSAEQCANQNTQGSILLSQKMKLCK